MPFQNYIFIQGKPVCITAPTTQLYGRLNQQTSLDVVLYSLPEIRDITWFKGDQIKEINIRKNNVYLQNKTAWYGNSYTSSMIVTSSKQNDAGLYKIEISNEIGISYCTVELITNSNCEYFYN